MLGTEYSFLDVGLESLCKFIKVPYRYLENLPIKLQIKNLSNGLAVPKDVKISINGNGYIRGVCSKKYQTPLLSEQLEGVVNSLFLKYDLEFYKIFEEKLYLIISFPKFSYEKYKPALSFRFSDLGGKEEIVCGVYHESGVFLPLVEPSLYLTHSQSYAKYSAEVTVSVLETMQKIIEGGEETFISTIMLADTVIANSEEWLKTLALTVLPKSFIKKLRERESVSRFVVCEMLLTEASSLRSYYDLLVRFSRELNTEFCEFWRKL